VHEKQDLQNHEQYFISNEVLPETKALNPNLGKTTPVYKK
jgi:hypothetical protein